MALTYEDLRRWLSQEGIDLAGQPTDGREAFVPQATGPGALYPIDGGMIAGIKANIREGADRPFYMAISGIHRLGEALADIGQLADRRPVFFECLACEGGCVNGPQAASAGPPAVSVTR